MGLLGERGHVIMGLVFVAMYMSYVRRVAGGKLGASLYELENRDPLAILKMLRDSLFTRATRTGFQTTTVNKGLITK